MSSSRLQPRKQPRQDRAEATRRRILEAAAHVFADFGYAAGTTNRIAERAEISIGSLYQYFPNKDAILVELMTAHTHRGFALIHQHLAAGLPDTIEDTLRVFVRSALGATVILAVYCLSTIDFTAPAHGTGPILGAAVTVGMHLWRRNAVLSIVVGTAACLLVTNLT
ncbi:Putative transcriptional regulator%2C TetR family [Mycobacteroides abscessus]|nr:Putative transcriptional regulator%2C TetR family [Mycobacteroides abscessus]